MGGYARIDDKGQETRRFGMSEQKKIVSSMIWRFGERFLAQIVTFIVSVVLARLVAPEEFGNIALLMVFIDVADVFVIQGFASALVQKKDADNLDFSSVFYFSLVFSIFVYGLCFVCTPLIGRLYHNDGLIPLFRVLALRIPIASLNSVQHSYVQRNMLFRRFFFATLGGTIGSAFLGIALAYGGYGAWAIVGQYLGNTICDSIVLWFTVKWRPIRRFSWQRLKGLFGFGWKMLGSALIHVLYNRLSTLTIGTVYTSTELAFYDQGNKIPGIVETNIDTTINSVLFPAMSNVQDDMERLKNMVRRSIRMCGMIIWPLMMGLAVLSSEVVDLVYGSVWLPCVVFMQIACIKLTLEPIQTANLQAIKAIGRSDVYIKMEILKKTYGVIALFITVRISVMAVAIGAFSQMVFCIIVNAVVNRKLIEYKFKEQLTDIIPSLLISAMMGVVVFLSGKLLPENVVFLFVKVIIGAVAYIAMTYVFRRDEFHYFVNMAKSLVKR